MRQEVPYATDANRKSYKAGVNVPTASSFITNLNDLIPMFFYYKVQ